jgi:DNA-binding HxlR family transcriptional regulator
METNHSDDADLARDAVRCLVDRIADRWALHVIGLLEGGAKRFTALRRESGGVSQKMLTQTLRGLERDGLVRRRVYAQVPLRVEYNLTPLGRTLCEPVAVLRRWAEAHQPEIAAARVAYDERVRVLREKPAESDEPE